MIELVCYYHNVRTRPGETASIKIARRVNVSGNGRVTMSHRMYRDHALRGAEAQNRGAARRIFCPELGRSGKNTSIQM